MASKEELDAVKRDLEIKELQRKAKIASWTEYLSFAVSKTSGLGAAVLGGLDILNPSLIPHIPHPEAFLGSGLALLAGKSVLNLLSKVLRP